MIRNRNFILFRPRVKQLQSGIVSPKGVMIDLSVPGRGAFESQLDNVDRQQKQIAEITVR